MADRICPSCKAKITLPSSGDTEKITCGNCNKSFRIKPSPPTDSQTAAPKPQAKPGKIDNTVLDLAITYGMISSRQANNVSKMCQKLRQTGNYIPPEKLLMERGLISEKQCAQLQFAKTFLELRDQDSTIAIHAEKLGLVTQRDIRQGFAMQLKLFKEKKSIRSVCDIFIKLGILSDENRSKIYKELNLKLPGEEKRKKKEEDEIDLSDENAVTEYEFDENAKLIVTNDLMTAFIVVTDDFFENQIKKPAEIAEDFLNFVGEQDIVYGITSTSFVVNFLESQLFRKQKRFKIASGNKPKQGRNAALKLYFETNYKRPGKMTEEGLIDFKDRGEVPFVRKGDLIAEKIPFVGGHNGRNIKGYEVEVEDQRDIYMESGSGAEMSQDGLKVFAAIDGQPHLSVKNVVSVFPELNINGDVDYATGHVEFDGNVEISGTVKAGFKVNCCNLTAKEIVGGDIDISGDLNVSGGIVQATIKCEGDIKSYYIQQSDIFSYGNLTVANEIIDSKVGINGRCKSQTCKIIATDISAKRGFDIKQIGNKMTRPCNIKAGRNEKFEKLLEENKKTLAESQENLFNQLNDYNILKDKQKTLLGSLSGQGLRQELAENEQKNILQEIKQIKLIIAESGQKPDDKPTLLKLKESYDKQEKILLAAKERTKKIFEAQSKLIDEILALYLKVEYLEKFCEDLDREIELLDEKYKKDGFKPVVMVSGSISAGTKIFGRESSTILNGDISRAKIIEIKVRPLVTTGSAAKAVEYKMDIQQL